MIVVSILLMLLQGLVFMAYLYFSFTLGWDFFSGIGSVISGNDDGFSQVGKAFLYLVVMNFLAGVLLMILKGLTEYVGNKA